MTSCIGEPISWLRLERYGLGELPAGEHAAVDAHLQTCPACQQCWQRIAMDTRGLPPLPMPISAPRSRRQLRAAWSWLGGALAAAAAVLLMLQLSGPHPLPPAQRSVKGGELAIELVRVGVDGKRRESDRFAPDDRWKALLTCPPGYGPHAELIVYQAGRAFFPLQPVEFESCGNHRALPGAFTLDGASSVSICIALSDRPLERNRLERGPDALPEASVCARVAAE